MHNPVVEFKVFTNEGGAEVEAQFNARRALRDVRTVIKVYGPAGWNDATEESLKRQAAKAIGNHARSLADDRTDR